MLIVTRKVGERIRLILEDGREIVIDNLKARPGNARLGIDAPPSVIVLREEIYQLRAREEHGPAA